MQTINKVQTTDSTIGTGTSTGKTYTYNSPSYSAEKGWECPRCGRINAPWVRQCDCSPSTCDWNKITVNPYDDWWKTSVDTFRIHPDSVTYCTNVNQVAGGSDYKNSVTGDWVNVPGTQTNSIKR